jgi:PilZ domain
MAKSRVVFGRADDRRDQRYSRPPVTVTLGAASYLTADWSLGGFRLVGVTDPFTLGAVVSGSLSTDNGPPEKVDFIAEVTRADPTLGEVAFKFVELNERSFDLLDRAISRRFRPAKIGR